MKLFVNLLLLLSVFLLLSGCLVSHSGTVSSGPLLKATDQYTDMAEGKAKSVFVFGFGDLNKENLVMEARRNMYSNRPLKKDEYYSNFSTSVTNKFILAFIHVTKVSVSADLMISTNETADPFSVGFSNKIKTENPVAEPKPAPKKQAEVKSIRGNLVVGDSVYYSNNSKDYRLYKVVSFDKENAMITSCDAERKNLLTPLDGNFFNKNREASGFRTGDFVTAEVINAYNSTVTEEGTILGFDSGYFLVETKNGQYKLPAIKIKHK